MMKVSASPGRGEHKFPPPLVRFNVGSRSRGRSRSSPMFLRRKVTASAEEPTSPKVTCMGQVRPTNPGPARRRCKWVRRALSCGAKLSFNPHFGKLFRARKPQTDRASCPEVEQEPRQRQRVGYEEAEVSVSVSVKNPPINALLLTRSRSAPYRSSSLASKFWGSPLTSHQTEEQEGDGDGIRLKPTSETDPTSVKSSPNPRIDPETEEKSGSENEVKSGAVHPLLLTRCKSEPARIAGEKLSPEMGLWRLTRFGVL